MTSVAFQGGADHGRLAAHRLVEKTRSILAATNSPDELCMYIAASDFLDAVYVASESLRRDHVGPRSFFEDLRMVEGGREVIGLRYLRGPSVHESVVVQDFTDRVSNVFYDHFGMWAWAEGMTAAGGRPPNRQDYEESVGGREIHLVAVRAYNCLRTKLRRSADDVPEVADLLPFGGRSAGTWSSGTDV